MRPREGSPSNFVKTEDGRRRLAQQGGLEEFGVFQKFGSEVDFPIRIALVFVQSRLWVDQSLDAAERSSQTVKLRWCQRFCVEICEVELYSPLFEPALPFLSFTALLTPVKLEGAAS